MKRLCLLLLPLLFAGCSTEMDPEDRRFYNRGWLFPKRDIDNDPAFDAPDPHATNMPRGVHPERYRQDPFSY